MILLKLFVAFFKVGCFAIGGAYSLLPLIENEVVQRYGWLTRSEFLDVMGITLIIPGAISVKYCTYVGYKIAGIPGVLMANLGNFLPPALLVIGATMLYKEYKELPRVKGAFNMIRIAVFSMIIAVAFQLIGVKYLTTFKNIIIAVCFLIIFVFGKIHPAFIIIGAGLVGAFVR